MSDSAFPWVANRPQDWEAVPLFAVSRSLKRPNVGSQVTTVLSLSYGKIVVRDVETAFGLLPASFETYNILEPGNIVLRLTDLQNDKRSLRTGLVKQRGIITSAYVSLEVDASAIEPRYLHYYLHAMDIIKVFYGMGGGVRQSMKFGDIRRLPVLIPPLDTQISVADDLDRALESVDRVIRTIGTSFVPPDETLGSLLNERKQSLVPEMVLGMGYQHRSSSGTAVD